MRRILTLTILTLACDTGQPCSFDDLGETGEPLQACLDDVPNDWPSTPVACRVIACHQDLDDPDQPLICSAVIHVEPGHWGNISIESSGSGELGWNEQPFNAEADRWENAEFIGSGTECGTISVNAEPDMDLGLYTFSRVYLTPNGPVVEP
jgi:hypothetical protein